jgi:pyruvate kinase
MSPWALEDPRPARAASPALPSEINQSQWGRGDDTRRPPSVHGKVTRWAPHLEHGWIASINWAKPLQQSSQLSRQSLRPEPKSPTPWCRSASSPMNASPKSLSAQHAEMEDVRREMMALRDALVASTRSPERTAGIHASYVDSARNLTHYLMLRQRDLRTLQERLSRLGLSSLGRAESHVLCTVDAVNELLHLLTSEPWQPPTEAGLVDFERGERLLKEHTDRLFGPTDLPRQVRIMVTMPSNAANEPTLVHELLEHGMDCMRINCAHDGPGDWLRMIQNLRQAERSLGKKCRVLMDVAGPKLRTGPISPDESVLRVRPRRDDRGRVISPAQVWLSGNSALTAPPPSNVDVCLTLPQEWVDALKAGGQIRLIDARDAKRTLEIAKVTEQGCLATLHKTAYFVEDTLLQSSTVGSVRVGQLRASDPYILVREGDPLILTRTPEPGLSAKYDEQRKTARPARIGCTIPEAFDDLCVGESVWFDDGRLGGLVERVESGEALIRITHSRPNGTKLRADKGINLPDSKLSLSALTPKDLQDLPFAAQHADIIGLSFVNSADDVLRLQAELERFPGPAPAVVLKIETRRGFQNLPDLLLAAMRGPSCGVMIARGDLAVECGFERLAEVQEEILWFCEAAHVPAIWATQVLESLAKEGLPSRAEISDAAMGHRAECVMLNKGPHVVRAVRTLNDILRRMQALQTKKKPMLRALQVAHVPSSCAARDQG